MNSKYTHNFADSQRQNRQRDAGVAFAVVRAQAELDAIVAIYAAPRLAVPIVTAAGLTVDAFQQDDLRALFAVADHARDREVIQVLVLARGLLRRLNLWDEHQPAGNFGAMRWSDATLAVLPHSTSFDPRAVADAARRLLWMADEQRQAEHHYREARRHLRRMGLGVAA